MSSMMDEEPKLWGAPFWICMRKIAERYPISSPAQEVSTAAKAYYESLMFLLPCGTCREHYASLLSKYPVNVTNRDGLMGWVELIKKEVDKDVAARRGPPPQHSAQAFRRLVPSKILPNQRPLPPGRANVFRQPTVILHPQQPQAPRTVQLQHGKSTGTARIGGCSSCASKRK